MECCVFINVWCFKSFSNKKQTNKNSRAFLVPKNCNLSEKSLIPALFRIFFWLRHYHKIILLYNFNTTFVFTTNTRQRFCVVRNGYIIQLRLSVSGWSTFMTEIPIILKSVHWFVEEINGLAYYKNARPNKSIFLYPKI